MKKVHSLLIIVFCLIITFQACKETIEPLPELTVTATQLTIEYGATSTILWTTVNATTCSSDIGNIIGVNGSVTTPPLIKTTTYSFTATGPGGTVTKAITIQVNDAPKPILKVTIEKDTINKGETVNLLIESTNAIGIHIKGVTNGNITENTTPFTTEKTFDALNGTFTSWSILETTRFTITATGIDGSIQVADEPIVVIVPNRTDTLCGRYWMITKDSKVFYDGNWHYTPLDEDELSRKLYFYKTGTCEVFKKSGEPVGGAYWSWVGQDSIKIGGRTYEYQLTDTTFIRSEVNGTIINVYKGFVISDTPK